MRQHEVIAFDTDAVPTLHIFYSVLLRAQVREITALARAAGVDFVFVDGAHAPGQLDLRLDELGCDAYVSLLVLVSASDACANDCVDLSELGCDASVACGQLAAFESYNSGSPAVPA